MERFADRLLATARANRTWLCVGLDPDPAHYPAGLSAEDTAEFLQGVLEAVDGLCCAVKPNAAFFEALGDVGHDALYDVVANVPPGVPVILDGKRNDIGTTAQKYAEAAFDEIGADAVTVNPYLGRDGVEPFARYADHGVFLLARTSNPSAKEFQDLPVGPSGAPLWEAVARKAMEWNREFGNLGLVAGATYPEELKRIRGICGDGVPLLVPGVGAQGADAAATLSAGGDSKGAFAVVNVGRAILQAGKGEDWQARVRAAAERYAAQMPFRQAS